MRLRVLRVAVAPFALSMLLVGTATAQASDALSRGPGATVSGVVRDSLARTTLAGAWVQLVAAERPSPFARSVNADSLGRFAIDSVPDGRYRVAFYHPMLDSLGVEPPPRDVEVSRHRSVRVDLAIPSPARLREAICGARSTADAGAAGGVVVGVVRDARGRTPLAGVTVAGEWLEISFRRERIDRRRPRVVVTTEKNGWFALCNVPSGGTMFLSAGRGADNTDVIEVQIPKDGFLRRELYVGSVRTDVVDDAPPVRVARSTFKAMLDTVRITAARVADRHNSRFEDRRRSGAGNYLTPADIKRRGAIFTSDIFRQVRGVRLGYDYDTLATDTSPETPPELIDFADRRILMRGITGNWCLAALYLDGIYLPEFNADALDGWVSPERIAGIEVYSEVSVPPEYQRPRSGCGSILIWTK